MPLNYYQYYQQQQQLYNQQYQQQYYNQQWPQYQPQVSRPFWMNFQELRPTFGQQRGFTGLFFREFD
jgi:hypothetical protein